MYNIAIDFGTSNTLIGVYNLKTKEISVESLSGISKKLGEYDVVPSIISYEKRNKFKIGANVELINTDPIRIFERFKLYFTKYKARKIKIDDFKIDHIEAAEDYLSLIIDFINTKFSKEEINKLIITAPVDSFDVYRVFLSELL